MDFKSGMFFMIMFTRDNMEQRFPSGQTVRQRGRNHTSKHSAHVQYEYLYYPVCTNI